MAANISEPDFRLLLSMAPAVVLVGLLFQSLALILYSQGALTNIQRESVRPLNVLLSYVERQRATSPDADGSAIAEDQPQVRRPEPASPVPGLVESARTRIAGTEALDDEVPAVKAPPQSKGVDWRAIANTAAAEYLQHRSEAETRKSDKWQTTGSVLFKPGEKEALELNAQILPSYQFRNPAGVLGLGLSFGQCFVGIPVAGIPVEDRTAAITIFYCRD